LTFCRFLECQAPPHKPKAPTETQIPTIENFLATVLSGVSRARVLNVFPVKYPRVIKQSTRNSRLAGKVVEFTLLLNNKTRSGKIYTEFSIGTHSISYVWAHMNVDNPISSSLTQIALLS